MNLQTSPLSLIRPARMHEVYGAGGLGFAAIVCAQRPGNVLWVQEKWQSGKLNPHGLLPFINPSRLLAAQARNQLEVLIAAEEALRDGTLCAVVMELSQPVSLTAGRRLQLAAKTGNTTGIAVIPEGMGSNAAETRWHCTPVFHPRDSTLLRWELKKNKTGTLGAWSVRWDEQTGRIDVVPSVGQRPDAARASG